MWRRPAGSTRPNARAIARGLSFAMDFGDPSLRPWVRRTTSGGADAAVVSALAGGGTRSWVPRAGYVLTGNGGYWGGTSAGNTYSLPTSEGTIIAAVVADHAAGDSVAHNVLHFGSSAFPAGPAFEFLKWSSNTMFAGWISTSDKRLSYSVTGLYSAGDVFTVANTWDSAGQIGYLKGLARGSNASTGFGDTSGTYINIGQDWSASRKWSSGIAGGVLYVLVFDRVLTAGEMQAAELDLWWWARQPWDVADLRDGLDAGTLAAMMGALPPISGDLSATFPAPSFTAASELAIAGSLSATFPAPTFTAAGVVTTPGITASRTLRLPSRSRDATLIARDRALVLPARSRTVTLLPERT